MCHVSWSKHLVHLMLEDKILCLGYVCLLLFLDLVLRDPLANP